MENLPKLIKSKKRLGLGYGSGKGGHTSGRGQKGQKSRGKIGILFEGVKMKKSFVKRLPFIRGKAKFGPKIKPVILNLSDLEKLPKTVKTINLETLISAGLVSERNAKLRGVKILGNGNITNNLNFELPVSKKAVSKIEKVGGSVK